MERQTASEFLGALEKKMRLINSYTIRPSELKPGDQMVMIVKAIVNHDGTYNLYRCEWNGTEDEIPQGGRIGVNEKWIAEAIFPVLE